MFLLLPIVLPIVFRDPGFLVEVSCGTICTVLVLPIELLIELPIELPIGIAYWYCLLYYLLYYLLNCLVEEGHPQKQFAGVFPT